MGVPFWCSKMNREYRNPEILRRLYWDNELNQRQIGEMFDVSTSEIGLWMKRLKIPTRSPALATHLVNANHVDLLPEGIEFLSGCLLGDGSLTMNKSISAMYQHTNKHREYLIWLMDQMTGFGIEFVGKIKEIKKTHKGHTYSAYHVYSRSYPELARIRNIWYGPDGKQPPRDLILTPLVLRQWFIDDGHYRHSRCRRCPNGRWYFSRGSVRLCNRSFSKESKIFLVEQLRNLGLDGIIHPDHIYIQEQYTDDFFDCVGPCPIPDVYGYKWPREGHARQFRLF